MARTRRSDYLKSNRIRTLPIPDPEPAARVAGRLLEARDAIGRRLVGSELLASLSSEAGIDPPELVVPDEHQPHRRAGARIVYSLQGEYRRRAPSRDDPARARGGKPLGRIRVLNRTPVRGDLVRPSAFLNTLLHEFCHHYDAEVLGLVRSFHTSGFYARLRHVRDQIGVDAAPARPRLRTGSRPATPLVARLWSIIRGRR
jgi:hypothetical protein